MNLFYHFITKLSHVQYLLLMEKIYYSCREFTFDEVKCLDCNMSDVTRYCKAQLDANEFV